MLQDIIDVVIKPLLPDGFTVNAGVVTNSDLNTCAVYYSSTPHSCVTWREAVVTIHLQYKSGYDILRSILQSFIDYITNNSKIETDRSILYMTNTYKIEDLGSNSLGAYNITTDIYCVDNYKEQIDVETNQPDSSIDDDISTDDSITESPQSEDNM